MSRSRFQQVLSEKRVPVGHMIMEFGTRGIARILEAAGPDFVVFDMEHSNIEMERIADLMSWCHKCSFTPMVRVPQGQYHFIARTMDAGAYGVMVPNVESAAQAKEIVNAAKYAPLGRRGVGLGTAHTNYVVPDPPAYLLEANERSTVICQIESEQGARNVQDIAGVPGVDVLWVGHFDLTQSMGIPGRFKEPHFVDYLKRVVAAAREYGKAAAIQPGSMEQAEEWLGMGYNVISWGVDIAVYRSALTDGIAKIRNRSAQTARA